MGLKNESSNNKIKEEEEELEDKTIRKYFLAKSTLSRWQIRRYPFYEIPFQIYSKEKCLNNKTKLYSKCYSDVEKVLVLVTRVGYLEFLRIKRYLCYTLIKVTCQRNKSIL